MRNYVMQYICAYTNIVYEYIHVKVNVLFLIEISSKGVIS